MSVPSTDWKEVVAADEEARFSSYADRMKAMQAKRDAKYGDKGRALHRKGLLCATAKLDVRAGLPTHAAHGLSASAGSYDAVVRFSNAGPDVKADKVPDVRGYAFKVLGVQGESAFGGPATSQDFALINRETFSSPKSEEFMGLITAAAEGVPAVLKFFVSRYGFFTGLKKVKELAGSMNKPFHGFANETFFSAAPIACGPYAARVRMLPASQEKNPSASEDWGKDVKDRLKKQALVHEIQLQFFVNETLTPIEDASVNWQAPYITVATLTLPQQDLDSAAAVQKSAEIEKGVLDPWNCLVAHRPLGDVMRARKVVYFASEKARGAL